MPGGAGPPPCKRNERAASERHQRGKWRAEEAQAGSLGGGEEERRRWRREEEEMRRRREEERKGWGRHGEFDEIRQGLSFPASPLTRSLCCVRR
eukprot:1370214-Rhodomonas_salina.1